MVRGEIIRFGEKMIRIEYYSKIHHLKQIFTGFHLLGEKLGEKVRLVDRTNDKKIKTIACKVYYRGKIIVYDVQDGYQDFSSMKNLLSDCDYYFKRSFSKEENVKFAERIGEGADISKMHPLGFNYDVTYDWCPINDGTPWKEFIKRMLGQKNPPNAYFKKEVIEKLPDYSGGKPKIFFQTRLWDIPEDYPDWKKKQWAWINDTRITIVKRLKAEFGPLFDGGVVDTPVDRKLAPEFILPAAHTDRKEYIERMKSADICINTTGLHMSIGGKTGEYIAASRAIVHEKFYYQVTGDFSEGKNYLGFTTADECVAAVKKLINDPELILSMQKNNREYYENYLEPCKLITNSLEVVFKDKT